MLEPYRIAFPDPVDLEELYGYGGKTKKNSPKQRLNGVHPPLSLEMHEQALEAKFRRRISGPPALTLLLCDPDFKWINGE